jgi:hypothetical protein
MMRFTKYVFHVLGNNVRTKHRPYVFEFLYSGAVEDILFLGCDAASLGSGF